MCLCGCRCVGGGGSIVYIVVAFKCSNPVQLVICYIHFLRTIPLNYGSMEVILYKLS